MHILIVLGLLLASAAHAQEVYPCGNSYSSEPCKNAKTVDVTPAVRNPDGPLTQLIYLCKRPDKSELWWIDRPCAQERWTLVESVRVPSNVDWDTQLAIAQRKRAQSGSQASHARNRYYSAAQSSDRANEGVCEQLSQRVDELDRMARAGGSVRTMEWIRAQRQDARDRQFTAGC
ncbi:hypothetical protein M2375_001138 [Comamonas sp. BIGb0152]|uniref:hypothetical protein n=1 Tax=Comamonas sp. BIGb0152 TaxID=2940601 RepID=UPI002168EFD8|nr:hypothetical protein [Comamonas sp. BIGb0152]MCS4292932.1 hypothetical protein [Comamonas sp. BIGb0152]